MKIDCSINKYGLEHSYAIDHIWLRGSQFQCKKLDCQIVLKGLISSQNV